MFRHLFQLFSAVETLKKASSFALAGYYYFPFIFFFNFDDHNKLFLIFMCMHCVCFIDWKTENIYPCGAFSKKNIDRTLVSVSSKNPTQQQYCMSKNSCPYLY